MTRGEQAQHSILDAAERLIAERGIHVSLRDIAIAAGQRNNSAVNYYFGNRAELIGAVVRRRLEPMERERELMLAALGPAANNDVNSLLRVLVLPLTTVNSVFYAQFLQAASLYLPADTEGTQGSAWRRVLDRLAQAVPTSSGQARRRRLTAVGTAMFALLAELERTAKGKTSAVGSAEDIILMLSAMLTAPIPEAATRQRARSESN